MFPVCGTGQMSHKHSLAELSDHIGKSGVWRQEPAYGTHWARRAGEERGLQGGQKADTGVRQAMKREVLGWKAW